MGDRAGSRLVCQHEQAAAPPHSRIRNILRLDIGRCIFNLFPSLVKICVYNLEARRAWNLEGR